MNQNSHIEYRCPLCKARSNFLFWAKDYRLCTTEQNFKIRYCENCGTAFTWPQLKKENHGVYYPKEFYTKVGNRKVYKLLFRLITWQRVRIAERLLKRKDIKVLDVGCGRGEFLRYASQRGWHPLGIEPSYIASIESAVDDYPALNILHGFLGDCHLLEGSIDVVTLWHVIEHVDDPISLLHEIWRILKDDGVLMMALPNFSSQESKLFREFWFHLDIPRHLFHFSYNSILRLVEQSGFRVEVQRNSVFEFPFSLWRSISCGLQVILSSYKCSPIIIGVISIFVFPAVLLATFIVRCTNIFFPGEVLELYCRKIL